MFPFLFHYHFPDCLFQFYFHTLFPFLTVPSLSSSRSHLLLILTVEGHDKVSGTITEGRLTLVDLAGSERISRTEARGIRLVEAAAINKSLSALGQVCACCVCVSVRICLWCVCVHGYGCGRVGVGVCVCCICGCGHVPMCRCMYVCLLKWPDIRAHVV